MYFPYLRGRQYELIAIRELAEKNLISEKIIPIIEPIKVTPTLLKTIRVYEEKNKKLSLIINPKVGPFQKKVKLINDKNFKEIYDSIINKSNNIMTTIIIEPDNEENIKLIEDYQKFEVLICKNKDSIISYIESFKNHYNDFVVIPNDISFKRKIEGNRILLDDKFNKQLRNTDYYGIDEPFSEDHLYYKDEDYKGFADYSVVGEEYNESGFAPYAVAIHITYFDDDNSLRINHFVSDSNEDFTDTTGKFREALTKFINWKKENKLFQNTYASEQLEKLYEKEMYPGLGTLKKLTIMHHIELMSKYLDGTE